MGISSLFKKKNLDDASMEELRDLAKQIDSSSASEKRIYPRYDFSYIENATAKFSDSLQGTIKDISYSGIAVSFTNPEDAKKVEKQASFTLTILGESTRAQATLIYAGKSWCGFFFHHSDLSTLVFLRKLMEAFRCGATMTIIDKYLVQDKYKSDDWIVLRGEGPADLYLQKDTQGQKNSIKHFLLTVLDGNQYRHVRYDNGLISTADAVDKGDAGKSLSSRMQNNPTPNKDILRKAVCLFSAINDPKVKPFISPLIKILSTKL